MTVSIEWEAYIHKNNQIQIKRVVWEQSSIDRTSPFVMKYLGRIECETRDEAEEKFTQLAREWYDSRKENNEQNII